MPGILIEATWDDTGEIDRICFLAEVKDGKQVVTADAAEAGEVSASSPGCHVRRGAPASPDWTAGSSASAAGRLRRERP